MKKQSIADKVFNKLLETHETEKNRDDSVVKEGEVRTLDLTDVIVAHQNYINSLISTDNEDREN